MIPIIEDSILGNDLDCRNFVLRNVLALYPVPPGLVAVDDPGLSDPRTPPAGSVVNDSVHAQAAISQSKLSLNGVIPVAWLGTSLDRAAQGSLVEAVSRKGVAGGYAPLDSSGKVPPANITPTAALGTVNSVVLSMPPEFTLPVSTIVASGSFAPAWGNVPAGAWFGVYGVGPDSVLKPSFKVATVPLELVPSLSGSKFTSGVFDTERVPVAVGMGVDHAPGAVTDPGEIGDPRDYIGRDMEWHQFGSGITYQPTVPEPVITLLSYSDTLVQVSVSSSLNGSHLFTRVGDDAWSPAEGLNETLPVQDGDNVYAYASRTGYNNSAIATWKVVTPLSDIDL